MIRPYQRNLELTDKPLFFCDETCNENWFNNFIHVTDYDSYNPLKLQQKLYCIHFATLMSSTRGLWTACLRKLDGKWLQFLFPHQHRSAPLYKLKFPYKHRAAPLYKLKSAYKKTNALFLSHDKISNFQSRQPFNN